MTASTGIILVIKPRPPSRWPCNVLLIAALPRPPSTYRRGRDRAGGSRFGFDGSSRAWSRNPTGFDMSMESSSPRVSDCSSTGIFFELHVIEPPAHQSGGIPKHHPASHKAAEQVMDSGKVLLHCRRGSLTTKLLDVCRNAQGMHVRNRLRFHTKAGITSSLGHRRCAYVCC
jgi:hypothetical protein